ncbi:hypothetical protein CC78DRAFT_618032 [Lojkania enalia]|uniref:F-box domain-containing protein n=1 Tax=Lojkania enalia TaxID=147567 RepID=A0A9P4N2Y8_9PLEO|nr:hypothetical protein CC78DRAFT_618032 [Didymosphaeria enalia]
MGTESSLQTLPKELVDQIVGFANDDDILSLRLTCRILEAKTFTNFTDTYFSVLKYDLSRYDTEFISLLAANERLRSAVKILRICTTRCTRQTSGATYSLGPKPLGHGYEWERGTYGELAGSLAIADDLGDLLKCKFINCRRFEITSSKTVMDNAMYGSYSLTPSDAIVILFKAISRKTIPVNSFDIDFRRFGPRLLLDPSRLYPLLVDKISGNEWSQLDSLYLRSCLQENPFAMNIILYLIESADSLRKLHIELNPDFTDQLLLGRLSKSASLPALRSINLLRIHVEDSNVLMEFLSRFEHTLTSIIFGYVTLYSNGWKQLIQDIGEKLAKLISFTFCNGVENDDDVLSEMFFCRLREDPSIPGDRFGIFQLSDSPTLVRDKVRVAGVHYRGRFMRGALAKVANSAYLLSTSGFAATQGPESPHLAGKDPDLPRVLGFQLLED